MCRLRKQPVEAVQAVVHEQGRVRKDHPLDRRMRDVPLVPQRHVLESRLQVGPHDPRQAADRLGGDRVALVRHRRRALLSRLEPLEHLADFGALEMAQLNGDHLARRGCRCTGPQQLGVAVPGDHLGRRHRAQTEGVTDVTLDRRVDVRVGPDRARQLADRDGVGGRAQTGAITIELQRPQRRLGAERRRFGVDAVGPTDHHGAAVPAGEGDDRGDELVGSGDEQAAGVTHRPTQRRVDDVGGRQPVMDPRTSGWPDRRLDDVDEGGHVVVGDSFPFGDGGDERLVDHRGARSAGCRLVGRDDPELGLGLGGEQFDLQPPAQPGRIGPHLGHLRERVARDHCQMR